MTAIAWTPDPTRSIDDFAVDLPAAPLASLVDRATDLVADGKQVENVTAADLPVDGLDAVLAAVRSRVLHGDGMVLLRGLPIDVDLAVVSMVFWRIGLALGRPVSQSVMGERLGLVRDATDTDPDARAYRNRNELTPHTDPADILAFLCVHQAATGGVSRFSSALAVYETMVRHHPQLLARLERGYRYHRFGEQAEGEPPITPHRVPVFSHRDGCTSIRYVRQYIEIAAAEDPTLALDDTDRAALDTLERLATRPEHQVEFELQPGEAVIANNFTILHARTAFTDMPAPAERRLLLRLWLAADPPRPIVPETRIYSGEPGIPHQPGRVPSYRTDIEIN